MIQSKHLLLLACLIAISSCRGQDDNQTSMAEHMGGDHDSTAINAELLKAAEGKPPVITIQMLDSVVSFDQAARPEIRRHVELLNAALVRVVQLHQQGAVQNEPGRAAVNQQAMIAHVHADKHENDLHSLLSKDQHEHLHAVLKLQAARFGLRADDAHGDRLFGTAGELSGIARPIIDSASATVH